MPKVSVIIPIYNVEKYLSKCLDSVVNQTLKDIEIICINDCSTDASLAILQDYTQKDKRIKIIDLGVNKGAANARNIGIDNAKGKYIAFLDSDDFVDFDFYEKLYKKADETNADVVKGNIYNYYEESKIAELTDFYNMNNKIRNNKAYFYYGFTSAIYKKSFIDKFNIRFPGGINYFEDTYFSIKACINYKKILFDDSAIYYYLQRKNSMSTEHLTQNKLIDLKKVISDLIQLLNSSNINKTAYYIIYNFLYTYVKKNYYNATLSNESKELLYDIIVDLFLGSKYQLKIPAFMYKMFLEKVADGKYYDLLLKHYKEYDYLNKNEAIVKILVSYIKPSFLFKSNILTPIHLGRSVEKECSKDGIVTDNDVQWLHDNCIGDNDFEDNISCLNRRIGFFTGTYWAWKNYEKLGNPEYFGSFGYRRLLLPNCLHDIQNYDIILPMKITFKESIKSQLIDCHGTCLHDVMLEVIQSVYPNELKNVTDYFDGYEGYFLEMYIMKKDLFFKFCEWISKIVNYMLKQYPDFIVNDNENESQLDCLLKKFLGFNPKNNTLNNDLRDFAFILERLTGYYLYKLVSCNKYKTREVVVFEPLFHLLPRNELIINKMRENVIKSIRGKHA